MFWYFHPKCQTWCNSTSYVNLVSWFMLALVKRLYDNHLMVWNWLLHGYVSIQCIPFNLSIVCVISGWQLFYGLSWQCSLWYDTILHVWCQHCHVWFSCLLAELCLSCLLPTQTFMNIVCQSMVQLDHVCMLFNSWTKSCVTRLCNANFISTQLYWHQLNLISTQIHQTLLLWFWRASCRTSSLPWCLPKLGTHELDTAQCTDLCLVLVAPSGLVRARKLGTAMRLELLMKTY